MSSEELLESVGDSSGQEFYVPMPAGFRKGRTKYVVVVGTVMSGLGKGIFASSLAMLLQDKGLNVQPIKLEGYLNQDSGTLNPFRHGEVFVLDDGMESDMDLGTYERLLDMELTGQNFATNGQIFRRVLEKEREGGYLGRDVQMIPHVTGEIKFLLRSLATKTNADVIFVEIGGTAGDFENAYYIEAVRQLAFEEGPDSTVFVALTYIAEPKILGEQKSKAAQLGIKRLMEAGIQPHIIACRAANPVTQKVREKIAIYTNVPVERVFSQHDCESIYLIPENLRHARLDLRVVQMLNLGGRVNPDREFDRRGKWREYIGKIQSRDKDVTIGITGKYTAVRDSYASLIKAIEHAATLLGANHKIKWIETTGLTEKTAAEQLADCDGIIVPGGFGLRGLDGKIHCVRYARENNLPFLGICLGFQMAVIEFARHVAGIKNATTAEIPAKDRPEGGLPVIDVLPEQKKIEGLGGNMRLGGHDISMKPDTLCWELFGRNDKVRMRFRHRYEVDPEFIEQLESHGMIFSGRAPAVPIMQMLELPDHPYFVGTQAHPCFTSRPLSGQPLFMGLMAAALARRYPKQCDFRKQLGLPATNSAASAS